MKQNGKHEAGRGWLRAAQKDNLIASVFAGTDSSEHKTGTDRAADHKTKLRDQAKTASQRKAEERQRHKKAGRVAVTVHVRPEFRHAIRALEAAIRLQEMHKCWQPIETAPRDGAMFWVRQWPMAPSVACFKASGLIHISYEHADSPTHWAPLGTEWRKEHGYGPRSNADAAIQDGA